MAITAIEVPQLYTPVYNDIWFVVASDNVAEDNFSYIFDIYIDDVIVTRHRISPRPDDTYGVFNPRRVLESYVSQDPLTDLDTAILEHANSWVKFVIKVGEEYDVAGVQTPDYDLYTSSAVYAINASLSDIEIVDYLFTDYQTGNSTKRFLTNEPDTKIALDERAWLYNFGTPSTYARREIKTYNAAGVLQNTFTANNSFTTDANDDERFIRTAVGTFHIIQQHGASALDDVAYYTVQLSNADGSVKRSEAKRFNIVDQCSKYTPIRLHFLNKLGGFDSFTFTKVNQLDHKIKRTTYRSGRNEQISVQDRFTKVSSTEITHSITCNSDWITDAESTWLLELLSSPVIYQEVNDRLISVVCTEDGYIERKKENEKVFNIRIKLDYGYRTERQRA